MNDNTQTDKELLNTILSPSEMVEYQEGSVVSRTLVKKPIGTVTLFAFAKGQSLSTHSAPFDAMVQVMDGTGDFTVADKKHVLKKGEMLIMPADIPHAVNANEKFKMMLIMIKA